MQSASAIMDGKAFSLKIKKELAEKILRLDSKPKLIIFTNSNPASQIYVKNKVRFGEDIGINVIIKNLYEELSAFRNSHGKGGHYNTDGTPFIIQLPIDKEVKNLFNLKKDEEVFRLFDRDVDQYDMDGFNPYNMGKLTLGLPCVKPCTPAGILCLLQEYKIEINGKRVCILGRSNIVGKPLALMMMQEGATVTNIHTSSGEDIKYDAINEADVLVSATGNLNVLRDISPAIVPKILVDVGMNRNSQGKVCGDIPKEFIEYGCKYYTPVPGGVGPMTVAMLFSNVVDFYENKQRRWGICR